MADSERKRDPSGQEPGGGREAEDRSGMEEGEVTEFVWERIR